MARRPSQHGRTRQAGAAPADEHELGPELIATAELGEELGEEEDDGDGMFEKFFGAPLREDPWERWPSGEEPIRELQIVYLVGNHFENALHRQACVEVEPGVIPDPRIDLEHFENHFDLRFIGRWNAQWRGRRLSELSLDLFSDQWPEILRLVFDAQHRVDLFAAYCASFPGLWSMSLCNHGTRARNARDEPLGHDVTCRDPRLSLRIGARYPGLAMHVARVQRDLWHPPTRMRTKEGRETLRDLRAGARAMAREDAPGAHAAMNDDLLRTIACLMAEESEPSNAPYNDPLAGTLDIYTLLGAMAFTFLDEADVIRVEQKLIDGLAAHATFADAIAAIRRSDPDRLPLWIDFTDDEGQPQRRRHGPEGLTQPLYGVVVSHEPHPEHHGPFHAVVPVGRMVGLSEEPLAQCALAIGPDDNWRFPIPARQISILTTHSGGLAVRNASSEHEYVSVDPPISDEELRREVAGHMTRTCEWVLARVGALLTALDDGLVHLKKAPKGKRTFELVRAPRPAREDERARASLPDPRAIAARLRDLGSLHRVAAADGIEVAAAYRALERAGIDPKMVLRDEVLVRWRRSGSVEAVIAATHLRRADVEAYLTEAGLDPDETPIPHDVTDPDVIAAVAAYRAAGSLEAAGERLGVSGETVRRRLGQAGLGAEEIETDAERAQRQQLIEAFERNGRSLAATARELSLDPRTVKEGLRRAGVSLEQARDLDARRREVVALHEQLGSARRAAAVLGLSVASVRRLLAVDGPENGGPRIDHRRVSDEELDRALAAFAQHGSIRAAARALGMSPGGFSYRLEQARQRRGQKEPDGGAKGARPKSRSGPAPTRTSGKGAKEAASK